MITTLKNNTNLLRKRIPIFKRKSEFRTIRKVYHKQGNHTVKQRNKLTTAERAERRAKVLSQIKKEERLRWLKRGIFMMLLAISAYMIYKNFQKKPTYHYNHRRIDAMDLQFSKSSLTNGEEYQMNMATGMDYFQQNKWFFADGYFEAALKYKPEDPEAEYQLALAYCLLCYYDNKACNKAEQLIDKLIKKHLDNKGYKLLQDRYLIGKRE